MSGSIGVDNIINKGSIAVLNAGGLAIRLEGGNDLYDGRLGTVVGSVNGDACNDRLWGGAGAEQLNGGVDNDVLAGGGGADTLNGGDGNDAFDLGSEATGIDTVIDSSGNDTILSTVTRSINGWAFIEGLILQGGAAINGTGNALNNGIVGNGAANVLAGLGGNDTILGGGGSDLIYGQVGFDDMNGQAGDDTFVYQSAGDALSSFMGFPAGDVIRGFDASGNDRINLQAVYGPALAYKGVAAFNGIGQVRIQVSGPDLFVQVNLDANVTTAEMALLLQATAIGLIGIDDFML